MTAPRILDPGAVLGQALSDASPDLMRHQFGTVINSLLSAEADAVCGAEWGQASPDRANQRNAYRHRDLDTWTARSTSRSPSCARAATSPSGSSSAASGPRPR